MWWQRQRLEQHGSMCRNTKATRSWKEMRKSSTKDTRGTWPCSHFASRLLMSRTVREEISVTLSHPPCGTLLRRPQETNTIGPTEWHGDLGWPSLSPIVDIPSGKGDHPGNWEGPKEREDSLPLTFLFARILGQVPSSPPRVPEKYRDMWRPEHSWSLLWCRVNICWVVKYIPFPFSPHTDPVVTGLYLLPHASKKLWHRLLKWLLHCHTAHTCLMRARSGFTSRTTNSEVCVWVSH